MQGYIHSLESFGTVDGPGVRYVVFFQGCPMRCQYCHNPDTWRMEDGTQMETGDIIANIQRNRAFYTSGGVTATGGEPMLQMEFLTTLFHEANELGIHTCLDTSGILFDPEDEEKMGKIRRLMEVTDLVMLDIKHIEPEAHKALTGHSNQNVLAFAEYLNQIGKPMRIRHVVVPGITFQEDKLRALGSYLRRFTNLEKLEVLPYHAMGAVKYENLGIAYPLEGVPQLTKAEAAEAERMIREGMKEDGRE